jgi:hypothetical protein
MKTTGLIRNEKFYIIVALVVVAAFLTSFKKIHFKGPSARFDTVESIDYKMARTEQGYAGYSLDGREVDEQYEGLKPKEIAAKKIAAAAKTKANTKKAVVATDKKQASAVTQAKAAQLAIAHHQAVIGNSKKSASTINSNYDAYAKSGYTPQANSTTAADAGTDQVKDDATKNKKSFAQWRSEIFASPTKETMTSFITAFRKGEVSATEYQAMAQDLLDQSDASMQGLGLMALRAQPSLASLSQLVHVESKLAASQKTYVQQAYLSYFQPQNIVFLNQALQTTDKVLLTKSLSLLTTNLPKIKTGDVSAYIDGRNLREAASVSVSINNFAGLLTALTALSANPEASISNEARNIASLIKSNATANSSVATL